MKEINMEGKTITVLGLGYIGLPTSIVLAKAGHKVNGYDPNEEVVKTLNAGKIHIVENNVQEEFKKVVDSGNFKAYSKIQPADVYIICVPTPFKEDNKEEKLADLSYVESAAHNVAEVVKEGDLVILESTVPPMTTKMVADIIEKDSGLARNQFHTAHCPERVLPGKILYELEHNDRIIGSEREESALMAKNLYESFVKEGTCYVTDDITAEMCKLVENTFRDINIAYANELSIICHELGIDVFKLIELANKHPRVNILTPGVGVGGHCIAVDPWFLVEKFGDNAKLINTARHVNDFKPLWVSNQVEEEIGHDKNVKIAVLGLAYKPNIDDLRESPSIILAEDVSKKGDRVYGCEPNTKKEKVNDIEVKSLDYVLENCDYLIITLANKEFIEEKEKIFAKKHYNCIGMK